MVDLRQHSIDVILTNQSPTGAYIACPTMPDYAYSWFRDGTFIAYAMDLVGHHDSARRFYDWGAQVIAARQATVNQAIAKTARGEPLSAEDYLHTRYTLTGEEGSDDEWPNFQLDGFGTWLWGLEQHLALAPNATLTEPWQHSAEILHRYLAALWRLPNYDCWEEFADEVHPYTLAAIYGGLMAYARMTNDEAATISAEDIRTFLLTKAVADNAFVKFLGSPLVDASLLGLATPYGVVPPDHATMRQTVARIEQDLRAQGQGVKRYVEDSYYGGGDWLLLTAWLGWYYAQADQPDRAETLLAWVASQALANGDMGEQAPLDLIAPDYLDKWVEWRGPIATPLLWSHAMYLILDHTLHAS